MGIGDVAHARIMVKANGDRNLRHDGVFVHLLFKRAGKFKMKAKISDSTWHGHARAWDDFIEFMSFLLFCLWICSFAKRFSAKQPQSGDPMV